MQNVIKNLLKNGSGNMSMFDYPNLLNPTNMLSRDLQEELGSIARLRFLEELGRSNAKTLTMYSIVNMARDSHKLLDRFNQATDYATLDTPVLADVRKHQQPEIFWGKPTYLSGKTDVLRRICLEHGIAATFIKPRIDQFQIDPAAVMVWDEVDIGQEQVSPIYGVDLKPNPIKSAIDWVLNLESTGVEKPVVLLPVDKDSDGLEYDTTTELKVYPVRKRYKYEPRVNWYRQVKPLHWDK